MNRVLAIGVMILMAAMNAHAQNSGYQGKHFSLNYNFYTSSAIRGPNELGGNGILSFNTNHHFYLDAVIGRRVSMGLSFAYVHTKFSFDEPYHEHVDPVPPYSNISMIHCSSNSLGDIEVYSAGIYWRFFFGGNVAPIGTYIKPEFQLQWVKVYPGSPIYNVTFPNYDGADFRNESPYLNYVIFLELGQNRLFFNRLFIDYGFRVGLSPKVLKYRDDSLGEYNYLEIEPLRRLSRHALFNVKAGVGLLLF